jgi:hypothetical protein
LAEDCVVALVDGGVKISAGLVWLTMSMPDDPLALMVMNGQDEPPAGWISRAFDVKTPIKTLVWNGTIHGDTRLCTRLNLSFGDMPF